nr:protein NRT1/ PTR FAMILY 5.8 [Ipomoea batatas]
MKTDLPTTKDDKSSTKKSLFFSVGGKFLGFAGGSLLGVSVLSYIQDTIGWGVGFALPTIAMAIKDAASRLKTAAKSPPLSTKPDTIHELELQEKPLCSQDSDSEETESKQDKWRAA